MRDRTAFVASREIKEQHLRSDFHFLEDVLQTRGTANRTFHKYAGIAAVVFYILTASEYFVLGGNKGTKQPKAFRRRGQVADKAPSQFSTTYQNLDNYSKGVKTLFHAVCLSVLFLRMSFITLF